MNLPKLINIKRKCMLAMEVNIHNNILKSKLCFTPT